MNVELELNEELRLNQQQVEFYKKNNFIKVKTFFAELIAYFNRVITKKVNEVNQQETPLEEETLTEKRSFNCLTFGN